MGKYIFIKKLLAKRFLVLLTVYFFYSKAALSFTTIEDNAARLISYIDDQFDGRALAIGGLSLGSQVAVEMLSQRKDICQYALIESALVKPMELTAALLGPTFGMSYGLIKQKWFAKLQAEYLGIPKELFDDYFRDTCKTLI